MQITVRYMAQLRQAAGVNEECVETATATTAAELLAHVGTQHEEAFRRVLFDERGNIHPSIILFLGDEQIRPESAQNFRAGAVLTVMTPMAGG